MKKQNKILHISNTNINWDYRILRALEVSSLVFDDVSGIGIDFDEGALHAEHTCNIISLKLLTMKIKRTYFFKYIRAAFIYFEFLIRVMCILIKNKPCVVHCHDTPALIPVIMYKLFFPTKIIYDAHELMSNKGGSNIIISKFFFLSEKLSWNKVDHFITVGEKIRDWYVSAFGNKNNTIIYNSPLLKPVDTIYNQSYLNDKFDHNFDNCVKFVFVGQLIQGRSIEKILNTFKNITKKNYVVFFVGYGELSSHIEECSKKYSNIFLHEALPHENLPSFLKLFDVGLSLIEPISLSDEYSLPNKLFEYLSAELFIIGSNLPEIKKLIVECNCGYIINDNLQNFLETDFTFIGNHSFDKIKINNYLWANQKQKLIDMYKAI
jgi:glycosyltransferase involved in cell wall biosynthesis